MKKISSRAVSVLLIAALVIGGLGLFISRYLTDGRKWALSFANANSGSSGEVFDRNGVTLARFDATQNAFSPDWLTRISCYHVTGDYWNRTGTGVLTRFWNDILDYSPFTGTTHGQAKSFTLNIDSKLNIAAFEALGANRKGAAMVVNYRTGELLCMVSSPSVDPASADADPPDGAYFNRGISLCFVPGSVFKLVTAAAAIETVPNMYDRTFLCEGVYEIAGVEINCTGEHGTQTFEEAMANSCNCAFAQIAVKIGHENMIKYVRDYGFLDTHSIDGIGTVAGSYPTEFIGDPELAWSCIGQSTDMMCPFSMLRFVSAVANGGMLCEPRLIHSEDAPETVSLVNADTADKLRQMMSFNVSYHYGQENFPGLRLCAKTGTAELGDSTSHAWFTGFLDDEEHPYAFVVLVERGGGGLSVAGEAANKILQAAVKET